MADELELLKGLGRENAEPDEASEVEVRASWTPVGDELDLVRHLGAWSDLLCATAGLPPPGVSALPGR